MHGTFLLPRRHDQQFQNREKVVRLVEMGACVSFRRHESAIDNWAVSRDQYLSSLDLKREALSIKLDEL